MAQKQITKTEGKTRAPRTSRAPKASKPAQEATQQEETKPAQEATQEAPKTLAFAIADYARPKAGAALFAHTAAFFALSGIADGKAYPKAKAVQVIGQTAVKYHTGNGNFEHTSEGVKLTDKGRAFFAARGAADPELFAAFSSVLSTGEINDKANVKAEAARIAIK